MNIKKANRRAFLKNYLTTGVVAGGAAAYGAWTKPAVKSVILPAHAATSLETFSVSFDGVPFLVDYNNNNEKDSLFSQLLSHTIESAHAEDSSFTTEILILPLGGVSYSVYLLITGFDGNSFSYAFFSGALTAGASSATIIPGNFCRVGPSGPPCFEATIEFEEFQLIAVNPGVNALISIDGNPPEVVPFVANPNMLSDPCTTCTPETTL